MADCNKCEFRNIENGCSLDYHHICTKQWNQTQTKLKKLIKALERIRELNKSCAGCEGQFCGVCQASEGKPNNSYKIADKVLKEVE
jgi:L-asparaginase II